MPGNNTSTYESLSTSTTFTTAEKPKGSNSFFSRFWAAFPFFGKRVHPAHDQRSNEYVDSERWGINREDLADFEREVREAWSKGEIPDNPQFPNPDHDNPKVGPNIYQVVDKFIKPRTQDGRSWALQRHPEGLKVDVFATHAWAEGVFEFIAKVRTVWPRNCKSMYICFLGNPQNGDINQILKGGSMDDLPFSKALKTSRYMLVIPNHVKSIYSRAWCVFEAHEALSRINDGEDLKIRMVWLPSKQEVVIKTLPAVLILLPAAGLVGYYLIGPYFGYTLGPVMWLLTSYLFCVFGTNLMHTLFGERFGKNSCCGVQQSTATTILVVWEWFEVFIIGLCAGIAVDHFTQITAAVRGPIMSQILWRGEWHGPIYLEERWENGEQLPCVLLMLSLFCLNVYKIFLVLVRDVLAREGHELDGEFSVVEKAECANEEDKTRILQHIDQKGGADEVNDAIHHLKIIGRYDKNVQFNLDRGMHINSARDGINPFKIPTAVFSWEFWWLTDLCGRQQYIWAAILAIVPLVILCCVIYLPTSSVWRCVFRADDRYTWALQYATVYGVIYAAVSNNHYFFTRDAVVNFRMTANTWILELVMVCLMIVVDLIFYMWALRWMRMKCCGWKSSAAHSHERLSNRLTRQDSTGSTASWSGAE